MGYIYKNKIDAPTTALSLSLDPQITISPDHINMMTIELYNSAVMLDDLINFHYQAKKIMMNISDINKPISIINSLYIEYSRNPGF